MEASTSQHQIYPMRVLHIDDDPDQVAVTKTYLESFNPGMEVVSSISPVDFQRMIETKEFDCVLCDYLMPEMNGIELCSARAAQGTRLVYANQSTADLVGASRARMHLQGFHSTETDGRGTA